MPAAATAVVAGRLLCDTYLAARDLVHEVDYTLSTLARNLLKQERAELSPTDIPGRASGTARAGVLEHCPACRAGASCAMFVSCYDAQGRHCLQMPPLAAKYESAAKLLQLVRHAESDAWLSLGLAFYLSVLPLTRQLVGRVNNFEGQPAKLGGACMD